MSALLSLSDLNTTINHEPRVPDLLLAQRLGFDRPRVIRELIDRNKAEIETYGSSAVRHGAYRGQPITEYFLNEGQALLICALSRTPKAAEVRRALIEVFMAWRRGQLAAPAEPPRLAEVPAHTRRVAVRRETPAKLDALVARLEAATAKLSPPEPPVTVEKMRDGLAVLWLNGRRYLVDTSDWEVAQGGRCLVADGSKIRVTLIDVVDDRSPAHPRVAWYRAADGIRDVTIIGRIVTETGL